MLASTGCRWCHVLPVALKGVRNHTLLVRQHIGNDVFAEIIGGCFIGFVLGQIFAQLLPGKDIDTHGSKIGFRLLRLLLELGDDVVLVRRHDAEAGRLLPGHLQHGDGTVGIAVLGGIPASCRNPFYRYGRPTG